MTFYKNITSFEKFWESKEHKFIEYYKANYVVCTGYSWVVQYMIGIKLYYELLIYDQFTLRYTNMKTLILIRMLKEYD